MDASATGQAKGGKLPTPVWVFAYLISPALPFACLRIERAISMTQCAAGFLAALLVQVGMVSVLGETNENPLQIFLVSLLGTSTYLIVLWQYLAGHAASLWSAAAERQWKIAGRFFGAVLALGLAMAILTFHLRQR